MDLKQIIERNYKATVKRGLITDKTTPFEFALKLKEEVSEWHNDPNDPHENADVILVILAYCEHHNIDIQKALEEKTIYNENRKD